MTTERRYCELREADGRTLAGVLVRYGDEAKVWGTTERIEPGAFGPDVASADIVLNAHHDRSRPLARTQGGGLSLTDSVDELRLTAELPATREADDAIALVRAKVLRGLSIEFRVQDERTVNGVRVITRAQLAGAGLVDSPAYPASAVTARHTNKPPTWWQ